MIWCRYENHKAHLESHFGGQMKNPKVYHGLFWLKMIPLKYTREQISRPLNIPTPLSLYPLSLPPGVTYLKSKTKQDIKKCWSGQLAKRTDAVEWFYSVQHRWVSKLHFQIKNDSFVLHLYPYWGTFMQKCLSTQNQTTISCISKKIQTTLIPVKSQMCR